MTDIESLQVGKTTGTELRKKFGEPDKVVSSATDESWFYFDHEPNTPYQRASFVLDKKQGLLLTAAWIPHAQGPFLAKDAALAHFGRASFQVKNLGWIAKHEYSPEADYVDPQLGISIRVNEQTGSVLMIGFGRKSVLPLARQE